MKYIETFPIKPQCSNGVSCVSTPDGGFLYLGGRTVNFVKPAENPLIKVFNTKQQITAVDIDPCWNTEGKFFATLTLEKSILIWDFDKGIAISGHKAHCHTQSEGAEKTNFTVQMGFMKNRNLLSLDSNNLVVYCVTSNSICVRPKFAPGKGQILTALKCSPYREHIFALGTNRGQIYICDIQKMAVVFTLGRHQSPVASLSWNLMEISSETPKVVRTPKPNLLPNEENDDIFNIYDYDYLENEFGAPMKNDKARDVEVDTMPTEVSVNPNFNFQEACESLKQEINAIKNSVDGDAEPVGNDVTLDDCRNTKNTACLSSMGESQESTEGSLEFVDRSSSSDENRHVDGRQLEEKKIEPESKTGGEECADKAQKVEKDTASTIDEQPDILLGSASNDGQIWIWNAKTGGCCDNLKTVARKNTKGTINIQIIWRNSSQLYVIDPQGEIVSWILSPNSSISKRAYKFERLPNSRSEIKALAFGISKNSDILWYISPKFEIVCENIDTAENILHYATATTNIMVARESPENNSKIALGFADRRIALLETSALSPNKVIIRYLQTKLQSCAKSLAWSRDGCKIAYGTIEGQVGFVNIDTKKQTNWGTIYGNPVYSIVWKGEEQIFMTCNDILFAYKIGNLEPLIIEGVKDKVSTVSLCGDYIFLGNTRGYIDIYLEEKTLSMPNAQTLTLKLIKSVEVAKKYITEIARNPINQDEFAVVSNEAYIKILSFNTNEGNAIVIRHIEFGKPKATVSSVKWSNRDPHKLITSGLDGALRVFDLNRPKTEELVFVKQFHCPLFTAMFLARDEKYAICTGKTITVEIVDTSHSDAETQMSRQKDGTLDNIKWASKMNIGTSTTGNKKKDKSTSKSVSTKPAYVAAVTSELTEKIAELAIDKLETNANVQIASNATDFLKTPQTLMNLITKEYNKNALEKLHEILSPISLKEHEEQPILLSQLFGNREDAEKVLNAELEKVKTQTTLEKLGSIFLSQVKGDVKSVILNAIKMRQLNEWHIALAPTVSFSFWQKCCYAFAEQLLEQGYALQAATYMLALHNQREAINMLMTAKYFKEALLIARIYLSENDSLIDEITSKLIDDLESYGNLPGAALICAVSHQYMRGYEILSKQRVIGPEEQSIINILKEKGSA